MPDTISAMTILVMTASVMTASVRTVSVMTKGWRLYIGDDYISDD